MVIEVLDIHSFNDSIFGENKAQIFTCQRLQRSRIFHYEHGEGINFTSLEGSRNWFGDSKKAVGAVKTWMFASFDSGDPVLHMRTAMDIADTMVLIVGRKLIGIIERIIGDSWKAERGE